VWRDLYSERTAPVLSGLVAGARFEFQYIFRHGVGNAGSVYPSFL